jgi:RimJ/RimL family protein N-acetyltransferase
MVGQNLPEDEMPTVDEAMTEHELSMFVEGFGRDGDYGIIAQKDGKDIGAAWYRRYPREGSEPPYELSIALEENYTGQGNGPKMISKLMRHANENGIETMGLQVHETNEAGRSAYEKQGFVPIREADKNGYIFMEAPTAPFAEVK